MKTCTKCGIPQEEDNFYSKCKGRNGLSSQCKTCVSNAGKKNHRYDREYNIRNHLQFKYGITKDIVLEMYDAQKGRCKICKTQKPLFSKHEGLVVDHCHTTGKIRGLLCSKCNTLLGNAQDNTATLLSAIRYLTGEENLKLCDTQLDALEEPEAQSKSA